MHSEADRPVDTYSCIREMENVRGGDTGFAVQLVREDDSSGRAMVRAVNEGGFSCVDIDLLDIVAWLHEIAPQAVQRDDITLAITALATSQCPERH